MGEANFRFVLWEGVRRNATRSVARGAISPIAIKQKICGAQAEFMRLLRL